MRLSQSVIERGQLILAKERIERVVLRQIKIRNIAKQRCGGSLAVTVDQRHAITLNGQILCQMNCQRRFSDTSFEVLHGHHTRSEEHTSELQSLMRISYDVFCLKTK